MILKAASLVSFLFLVSSLIHPGSWTDTPDQKLTGSENALKSADGKVYASLHEPVLNPEAFRIALSGYRVLHSRGLVQRDSLITIIDYSLPSSEDRFFVIDLRKNMVIYKTLVAHGRNSGELYATRFSNLAHSHRSALGFYITGSPYHGGQGYSMMLTGMDTGYNDHARTRSIVIHGARYATPQYIKQYGRLGRSFGCPALPPDVNEFIIDCIKEGSVLFSYYPDREYIRGSTVLSALSESDATGLFP
jgi:hypothetical protein